MENFKQKYLAKTIEQLRKDYGTVQLSEEINKSIYIDNREAEEDLVGKILQWKEIFYRRRCFLIVIHE